MEPPRRTRAVLALSASLHACSEPAPAEPTPLIDHTIVVSATVFDADVVGVAAAVRTDEFVVDDLYGAIVLQRGAVPVPEGGDPEFVGVPAPWAWGDAEVWVELGEGLRILDDATEVGACLTWLGARGEFPVYVASAAMGFDASCDAPNGSLRAEGVYDLEVFVGSATDEVSDSVIVGAIEIPVAPELEYASTTIETGTLINLSWTDDDRDDDVVQLRATDRFGNVVAWRIDHDGGAELSNLTLAGLELGPVTVVVARTLVTETTWAGATIRGVGRAERRLEIELR